MLITIYNLLLKLVRIFSLNGGATEISNTTDNEFEAERATKRVTEVIDKFDENIKRIEKAYPIRTSTHDELDDAISKLPPITPKA